MAEQKPNWTTIAWHAIRPHTLPLSLSPVLVGSVAGWAESGLVRLDVSAAAAISAACMQIGANLQNDAADALNGTDDANRAGPPRVTSLGWASPKSVLSAAWGCFALALITGLYLVAVGGWPLVCLGLIAVTAAWAYSGGPRPIARGPYGELVVLVFFGLVAVAGVAWLYSGRLTAPMLTAGLVVGLPAAAVLTINNLRDLSGDRRAGRRTLAIVLGPAGSVRAITVMLVLVAPALSALAIWGRPWSGALLALPVLALAPGIVRRLAVPITAEACNSNLKRTTRFQLMLSLVMSAGMILIAYFDGTVT
ncbi:MAG: 1,4-dihydroxy-2-naphthoate octaprenyltransferase [Wenzhouxiangella sp.]|jgi:1,4-dihydroxy-2-naphthoate octaprenyltransferase|nr:1,4-dihydroxy-2-naphthoate octaprenyltransferase [Wenzhouxiangella sp.]